MGFRELTRAHNNAQEATRQELLRLRHDFSETVESLKKHVDVELLARDRAHAQRVTRVGEVLKHFEQAIATHGDFHVSHIGELAALHRIYELTFFERLRWLLTGKTSVSSPFARVREVWPFSRWISWRMRRRLWAAGRKS